MDKQAPSAEAVEIAADIKAMLYVDHDNGRGDEERYWATFADEQLVIGIIEEALRAAEQRGIKAGLEAAAVVADKRERLYSGRVSTSEACAALIAEDIRAISPATVQCKGE